MSLRKRRHCSALRRQEGGVAFASSSTAAPADRGTVAALATAVVPQAGGVAIVRMSGPEAVRITRDVFQPGKPQSQRPQRSRDAWKLVSHTAQYGGVYDASGRLIDEARPRRRLSPPASPAASARGRSPHPAATTPDAQVLLLPMLAPRSYTKEDVVEIHCHGGSVCARSVLQTCLARCRRPTPSFAPRLPRHRRRRRLLFLAAPGELWTRYYFCRRPPAVVLPPPNPQAAGAALAEPGEFTLRAFLNGERAARAACALSRLPPERTPLHGPGF